MISSLQMPVVDALEVLASVRGPDDIVITNQASARVWPHISNHPLDFAYNPSTMGGAVPLALGLALAQPRRHVIVVSGDGALLMSLGCLVTVADCQVPNLTIVVLENGLYEVTGGQWIPGRQTKVKFHAMALAAGFSTAVSFADLSDWRQQAGKSLATPGPRFIGLRVQRTPPEYFTTAGLPITAQIARLRAALGASATLA